MDMLKAFIAGAAAAVLLAGAEVRTAPYRYEETITGRWTEKEIQTVPPEITEIFEKAITGIVGFNYRAVEVIDTQIVNGTNYRIRAESKAHYADGEKQYAIITIHEDLNGNVSVLDFTLE